MWCYVEDVLRQYMGWGEGVTSLLLSLMMHRHVLAVHYLNKKPGLNSVLLALARFRMCAETSYTPVSQVFPNALWLGSQRQNTASTNTKQPSLLLTGVSQWIWSFFHVNMNMLKQKTQKKTGKMNNSWIDRGINEECILYFNLNGRKKIVRQTWRCAEDRRCSKMCKLLQRKHNFIQSFPTKHKHDVSENLASLAYTYIYIYISLS